MSAEWNNIYAGVDPNVMREYAMSPMAMTPAVLQQMAAPNNRGGVYAANNGGLSVLNTGARNKPSLNPSLDFATVNGQQGYQFVTNKGKVAKSKTNPTGFVAADPEGQYRLVNLRGGESVLTEGTGEAGLQDVYRQAQQLSAQYGKKAYWSAERLNPATGQWERVAYDPRGGLKGAINKVGDIALPALGGLMMAIPGMQPFGALGIAAGAAGGSTLSSVAQGRSLGSTLGRALISGGLAYGGASLGAGLAGAGSAASGAGSAVGQGALSSAGGTIGGIGGSVGNLAGTLGNQIIVNAAQQGIGSGIASSIGGALSSAAGGALGSATGGSPQPAQPSYGPDYINVIGNPSGGIPLRDLGAIAGGAGLGAAAGAASGAGAQQPVDPNKPTGPNRSTLDEIALWAQRAGLASSLLGGLFGGGGGGGGKINPAALAGLGQLNPIFGAQLPASNLAARQPRDMTGVDWNRYAMGPERSFYTDVPQRYAEGGEVSHGRSDDVPALLSRGEYVIDAETMALLGNGDPMAGADVMDKWRVNVRKHKGRSLMKGEISPDAKMPEQYMGGGRI